MCDLTKSSVTVSETAMSKTSVCDKILIKNAKTIKDGNHINIVT